MRISLRPERVLLFLIGLSCSLVVMGRAWAELSPHAHQAGVLGIATILVCSALLLVGTVVGLFLPPSPNPSARVCALFSWLLAVWLMTYRFMWPATTPAPWPILDAVVQTRWLYAPWIIPLFAHLMLVFPSPQRWMRRHGRILLTVVYAQTLLYLNDEVRRLFGNPQTILGIPGKLIGNFAELSGIVLLLACAAFFFLRARSFDSDAQRARHRWVGAGLGTAATAMGGLVLFPTQILGIPPPFGKAPLLTLALVPLSVGFALLHNHALDSDRASRRAFVRLILGFAVAALYLPVGIGLSARFGARVDTWSAPLLVAALGLSGTLLLPLLRKLQRAIESSFDRGRRRDRAILAELNTHLPKVSAPRRLDELVRSKLPPALDLEQCAIWVASGVEGHFGPPEAPVDAPCLPAAGEVACRLRSTGRALIRRDQDGGPDLAELPESEADALESQRAAAIVPVMVRSDLAAMLLVGPRRSGASFDRDDIATLWTLAHHLAISLENGRLLAEEQRLSAYYQGVLAGIATGVVVIDGQGRVESVNRAAERLLDGAPELGRDYRSQQSLKSYAADIEQVFATSKRRHGQLRASEARIFDYRAQEIEAEGSAPRLGIQLLIDDVSAQRQLQHNAAVHERLESLGRYAATLISEVQASAAGVLSAVEALERSPLVNEDQRDEIVEIRATLQRITEMVVGPLKTGYGDAPRLEVVALDELLDAAVTEVSMAKVGVQRQPWECLQIRGDARALQLAFRNLVHNAVQAMAGEGLLRLGLRQGAEGSALIEFADSGPGVGGSARARIFEPFVSSKEGGHGLGLALVRQIVIAHGGSVGLRDETTGGGSQFEVVLPNHLASESLVHAQGDGFQKES